LRGGSQLTLYDLPSWNVKWKLDNAPDTWDGVTILGDLVIVTDQNRSKVVSYSLPTGGLVHRMDLSNFSRPQYLCPYDDDSIIMTSSAEARVGRFPVHGGTCQPSWCTPIRNPQGVCVHDTLIYVGEFGSHNIHIITGSGESRTYTNVIISAALKITSYLY